MKIVKLHNYSGPGLNIFFHLISIYKEQRRRTGSFNQFFSLLVEINNFYLENNILESKFARVLVISVV